MSRRRMFVSNVCLGRRLRVMPLGCLKDSSTRHSRVHLSPLHDSAIGGERRFSGSISSTIDAAGSNKAPQVLHYEWLHPKASVAPVLPTTTTTSPAPHHHHEHIVTVVLHGLLGNVRNIKTLATRLCELPTRSKPSGTAIATTTTRASIVMDLTGHGRSAKQNSNNMSNNSSNSAVPATTRSDSTATTVADVARDVAWTLRQALLDRKGHPTFATPGGSPTIPLTASSTSGSSSSTLRIDWVGHSLGGRVALYHAVEQVQNDLLVGAKEPVPTMSNLWLLDTVPHAIDASVQHTLSVARDIVTQQRTFASSKDFIEHLQQHADYRLSSTTAQWLATQYDLKQRHFAFDVGVAESLARDIPQHDFWKQVDRIVNVKEADDGSTLRPAVHLIVGAKNTSWTDSELERVSAYSRRHEAKHCFTHHILPQAGHWVHIDDLPGILNAVQSVEERPH